MPSTSPHTDLAGVAALTGDKADCEALLDATDRHLCLATQQGRNRVVAAAESADASAKGPAEG